MDKYLLYACCILFTLSCANLTKREIVIKSLPDKSQVEVFDPASNQYHLLGVTPLTVKPSKIKEILTKDYEYIALKVSHRGYVIENLVLDTKLRKIVNYTTALKKVDAWTDKENDMSSVFANKLTIKIQEINQEIISKNFSKALVQTQVLIEQYPKAHVYYDIKGSVLYLMGRRKESLSSYNKSLSINPDNAQSQNMVKRIKGI